VLAALALVVFGAYDSYSFRKIKMRKQNISEVFCYKAFSAHKSVKDRAICRYSDKISAKDD